jgi:hypothetical protein
MRINWKATVSALAIAATTLVAVAPADAQWRGRGHHHRGYNNGGAILGGLAAGAILGGVIASQNRGYYNDGYAPRYYGGYSGGGDQDAYCFSRFKSYDPASGTYLGYDGYRHPCP